MWPNTLNNHNKALVFGSPSFDSDAQRKIHLNRWLGRTIVQQPSWALLTGGQMGDTSRGGGTDYNAALGALESLEGSALLKDKLITLIPYEALDVFRWGTVLVDYSLHETERRQNLIALANVVITIEGGPGTAALIEMAIQKKTPVIPIGGTRGASKEAWQLSAFRRQVEEFEVLSNNDNLLLEFTRDDYSIEGVCSACSTILAGLSTHKRIRYGKEE